MAKYMILWRRNPVAPWPTTPEENLKFMEKAWAGIDNLIKKGEILEMGIFVDGNSGYSIGEGDSETTLKNLSMFLPFWIAEVHEIVPYPKSREVLTNVIKAQIEAAKT